MNHKLRKIGITVFMGIAIMASHAFSADLPTAKSIALEMGAGWNLGNTMEAPGSPTAWGNVLPSQAFIDSVKKAGFNTIRLPCAWDGYANQTTYAIDPLWMAQVKQVVDYCIKDSLFVVLNIHWDGGWLESNIAKAITDANLLKVMKAKQGAYWRQIATVFKDYGRHMLLASTNEPSVETVEQMAILKDLHQIFIDTVRATGSNNASRTLILPGPSTSFERTSNWMTLPTDKISQRLMVECHFYPYQFTLMSRETDWGYGPVYPIYYWGQGNHSTTDLIHNADGNEEAYVTQQFDLMKSKFLDQNVPVLVGEFGAMKRLTLTGDNLLRHVRSRRAFYNHVVKSAKSRGMIPVVWDAGGKGDGTMTVFHRKPGRGYDAGKIYDLGLLNAIRDGIGLPKLAGDTSLAPIVTGSNSMRILYSAKDSGSGQVGLGVIRYDMSNYDSIYVKAYVKGTKQYDSLGTLNNCSFSLNLVTMSKNWTWREAKLGTTTFDTWQTYGIGVSTVENTPGALSPADIKNIDVFSLLIYSHGFRGAVYVDWIIFKSKSGVRDTVYSFDQYIPEEGEKNVEVVEPFPTSQVENDNEWLTATTTKWATTPVLGRSNQIHHSVRVNMHQNSMELEWYSLGSEPTILTVSNLKGQTLWEESLRGSHGMNRWSIPIIFKGKAFVSVRTPGSISSKFVNVK